MSHVNSNSAETIQSLELQLSKALDEQERVKTLNALAWAIREADLQRSAALCEEAYEHLNRHLNYPVNHPVNHSLNHPSTSEASTAPVSVYTEGLAQNNSIRCYIQWRRGELVESLHSANQALLLFATIPPDIWRCRTYITISNIYDDLGERSEAIDTCLKAIESARSLGAIQEEAQAYHNLGVTFSSYTFHEQNVDQHQAVAHLRKAYDLMDSIGDDRGKSICLYNLVISYTALKDFAHAMEAAQDCLALSQQLGDDYSRWMALLQLGRIHNDQGEYEKGLHYLQEAIELAYQTEDLQAILSSLHELGELHLKHKEPQRAIFYLLDALNRAEETNHKRYLYELHSMLSGAYEQMGDYQRSLEHYQQFHQIRDTCLGEESERKAQYLEARFHTETARREAELNRQKYVELEAEMQRRLALEAELRQAKEVAEAAARTKAEFLANMSHEIRTPLNGIIGMTSLLLNTTLDDNQLEFVETARKSGEILLGLINNILDFSKIEAGKLELEIAPFHFAGCVEDVFDLLGSAATAKQLEMTYFIAPNVPESILGDLTRLRQILVNLVHNAIKFTERGEVAVNVTASRLAASGKQSLAARMVNPQRDLWWQIDIEIRDSGIGISPDDLQRLFQSFSQVDASMTRRFSGTGLGLAICKRLVEMMNGRITVESEVAAGSTFRVSLPVMATNEQSSERAQFSKHWNGERVLIYAPNTGLANMLRRTVGSWGLFPIFAATPMHWQQQLIELPSLAAAIVDISELSSEVINEARLTNKHLPFVLLANRKQLVSWPKQPATAYISKPIKVSSLYQALCEVFATAVQQSSSVNLSTSSSPHTSPHTSPHPGHEPSENYSKHSIRILLAEDNLVNQRVAIRMLEKLGHRADVVANGYEVLDALERQSYDVVLLDIQMPEMDGMEAANLIRKRFPVERQPYIIALTANVMEGDRELYMSSGMNGYLSKPFTITSLNSTLANTGLMS